MCEVPISFVNKNGTNGNLDEKKSEPRIYRSRLYSRSNKGRHRSATHYRPPRLQSRDLMPYMYARKMDWKTEKSIGYKHMYEHD